MKKFVLLYSGIFLVLGLGFFPFRKAYREWILYSELVNRANTVFTIFQELSSEINNAAVINPDLLRETKYQEEINIFNADSTSIFQTLHNLNSLAGDSVNVKIVAELDLAIKPELSWIIKSNVPDSIVHHKAKVHLKNLEIINKLIEQGKSRTKFLLHYRSARRDEAFNLVGTWIIVITLLSFGLLLLTVINLYKQQSKRKEKELELQKSFAELSKYKFALDESAIIALTDQKGIIKHVNENFCRISQYNEAELLGQDHRIINSGYHSKEFIKDLWNTIANGKIWKGELKNRAKDNSYYWVDTSIVPFLNEVGKPYQYLVIGSDITERKKAEEKLFKVNRLYRFISNINKSIVHLTDEQELLDNACKIATEIGEFKLAYIGMLDENGRVNIISLSGDKAAAGRILKLSGLDSNDAALKDTPTVKVLRSGKYEFNNDMQTDPSMRSWAADLISHGIHASISLPIFKSGKVAGIFGFYSSIRGFFDTEEIALLEEATGDISFALNNFEKTKKHNETEELIIKNEKRFRGLIEKSSDMKTLTNSEGVLTYISPSVLKSFGLSTEEIVNKKAMDFFHEEDIQEIIRKRNEILGIPGASYVFTQRLRHKNGSWIWCEGTVTNLLFEPAVQAMVTNFRDITEKRHIEQQRLFDKNNLNALINSTDDLMWSIDRDFRLITFNTTFRETIKTTTGITIEVGTLLLNEKFDDKIIDPYRVFYTRALSGETFTEIIDHELTGINWSEVSFYPIYNETEVIGTACFLRNITERKKSEEQLAKNASEKEILIQELSQNNKDLQQFAYITSHNLRGPVASLLGLANLLDGFNINDKTLVQILSGIKKASLNFDETIRDLNTILSVKDSLNIKSESLPFEPCLLKTLEQCDDQIKESKAEIIYNFDLSPEVNFNRSYLESIFMNLLTNALKYRDHTRNLKINIQTKVDTDFVILTFSDNGIGMDLKLNHEKIFKLYQRFHTVNEGKGLGLFLIKSQLEALGGVITVESEIGKGTGFTIRFRKI